METAFLNSQTVVSGEHDKHVYMTIYTCFLYPRSTPDSGNDDLRNTYFAVQVVLRKGH